MKSKLLQLGLSDKLCEEILALLDTHTRTVERYSKPKGRIAFQDSMAEIELLTRKLKRKLEKLTDFEKKILYRYRAPAIIDLKVFLGRLEFAITTAKKSKVRFSRKQPFVLSLAEDLRGLLESNEIPVKQTRNNMFCKVLDILLDRPQDSERAFNLLRELSTLPSL